jgi:RNA polymerase sigma-70 factor (ECF subfamily)
MLNGTTIDEKAGVLESFEAVALPHTSDLFRTAMSLLRNRSEAEDAVQETLLQAWKSFHRFESGTNCRAWLFKILFHVVSHQRRKWSRMWLAEDPQILEDKLTAKPVVADDLTDEHVLAAFSKIPQRYAEVVMLADVQEFSYKEIQETLGIPIGTVMSRLSRGRECLRGELGSMAPVKAARAV